LVKTIGKEMKPSILLLLKKKIGHKPIFSF
jgi:hypothetical protein